MQFLEEIKAQYQSNVRRSTSSRKGFWGRSYIWGDLCIWWWILVDQVDEIYTISFYANDLCWNGLVQKFFKNVLSEFLKNPYRSNRMASKFFKNFIAKYFSENLEKLKQSKEIAVCFWAHVILSIIAVC